MHDAFTRFPARCGHRLIQQQLLLPLQVGDKLKTFEVDEEPIPGFKPLLTPWHTPGSVAFAIADGDSELLFTGDAVSHRILTIENPYFNTSRIDFSRDAGARLHVAHA